MKSILTHFKTTNKNSETMFELDKSNLSDIVLIVYQLFLRTFNMEKMDEKQLLIISRHSTPEGANKFCGKRKLREEKRVFI